MITDTVAIRQSLPPLFLSNYAVWVIGIRIDDAKLRRYTCIKNEDFFLMYERKQSLHSLSLAMNATSIPVLPASLKSCTHARHDGARNHHSSET